jgi:hypothetical protein
MPVIKNVEGQVIVKCEYFLDGEFKNKEVHEDMINPVVKF